MNSYDIILNLNIRTNSNSPKQSSYRYQASKLIFNNSQQQHQPHQLHWPNIIQTAHMSSSLGPFTNQKMPPKSLNPANTSSNQPPLSKLHQYFASSQYLSSQDQLAIFIQNFPIIDIQASHKSINDILPLLIRQNQLLGRKCQSQVLLIKQSFVKHESMNRQNKRIRQQTQDLQKHCREVIRRNQDELVITLRQKQEITLKIDTFSEFILHQNQIMRCIVSNQLKKCQQLTNLRQFRLIYQDFQNIFKIEQVMRSPSYKSYEQNVNIKKLISLQEVQKYCKQTRRKGKYLGRVKSSVQEFCNRLVKISSIVPPQLLSQELGHQCQQFLGIVNGLISCANGQSKRRREESGSKKRNQREVFLSNVHSDSSLMSKMSLQNRQENAYLKERSNNLNSQVQQSTFQNLISMYSAQTNKKSSTLIQQLQNQISELRQQLQTSKQYYESYLINSKMQIERQRRQFDQEMTIKDQMVKHFQAQLQRLLNVKEQLQNGVNLLTQQNQQIKCRQRPLEKQIQQLYKQIQNNQTSISQAKQRSNTLQQSLTQQHTQKQLQFASTVQKLQGKQKQKQQQYQLMLNRKNQAIQQKDEQITQLNKQIRQIKEVVQDKNVQISRITKRLYIIEEDHVKKLQRQVHEIQSQIAQSKRQNRQLVKGKQQLSQQIALNSRYIKQLQSKALKREQAIQRLNQKLCQRQAQQKSSKQLKEMNQKLQSQLSQFGSQLRKTYQENSNLKRLVKQMKRELEQVYRSISGLKSIQRDRQKLMVESQKSQRWKEQIMRDYDQLKYEILKVESENKNLALEVKHYKNALKRIQMIN